ncbi:MAG: PSD1 and planctomycete cytochrome C domain-containing protein [Planctomycetaceae bacterium]|nr:PSD1 and planctomycete cytochrome C domain-containing protein [Planctomycetaceae bacterium]
MPALLAVTAMLPACSADESARHDFTKQQITMFREQVLPILEDNCLKCHSGEHPKGELNMTTREGFLKGGESGPAVDLENHEDSYVINAVRYEGLDMPPSGPLSPQNVKIIESWVQQGLPWPADLHEIEFEAEAGPPQVTAENRQFWSFQPVRDVAVPDVENAGHNAIDAFIRHRLSDRGLTVSPPAAPEELVRRMHYDLLGLPPSPEFVAAWSKKIDAGGTLDQQAVAALTDELLASPHYGEQWGRHWLDLVRYAETNSYERDGAKPHVWRYRDYVIDAFNSDKPYSQFIIEQLAGDELDEVTADSMVATGFYRLGRWDDEPADPALAFYDDIDDIVTTTSQTFLGLTVNCARCHDHKIDPIPQRDYYRMVAFFRNVRRYGVRGHDSVLDASVAEIDRPADAKVYEAAMTRYNNDTRDAKDRMAKIEKLVWDDLQEVEKEDFQYDMNKLPILQKRVGTLLNDRQFNNFRNQFNRLKQLQSKKPTGLASALCVKEDIRGNKPTHILTRGNPHAAAEEVTPGFPAILSPPKPVIPQPADGAKTSGRRRVLAEWIASGDNPLTARVMVNRIWQFHFGRGIVRTSSDFGFQGTKPTHPKLLDWLAAEFVKSGWSVKAMHRLIMSSAAYQMSSRPSEQAWAVDPTNNLFWRFDMRRLSAEEVRDTILWVNNTLNSEKMYGPSIYTDIPDAVKAGQSRPGSGWGRSSPEDETRRSIYIHVKRSLLDPLIESFDFADTDQTCPVRFVTTQPTQALSMMNSEFILQQAEKFAAYVATEQTDGAAQVQFALARAMQRQPTNTEIQRGLDLIASLKENDGMNHQDALKYLCLVALNLNELMYLD